MHQAARAIARAALPQRRYDALSFALRRRGAGERAESEETVATGPFAGLRYPSTVLADTNAAPAKLAGVYERELHGAVERVLLSPMSTFVDIGCAEGYYAVGVALRRPDVRVIAFDIDPATRHLCRLLARANGVDVDVRGAATTDFLATLEPGTALLSDCEGCEGALLDPVRAPALVRLPLIVEVHDFLDASLSPRLLERFGGTHWIETLRTQARDDAAFDEGRPAEMQWLVMHPLG